MKKYTILFFFLPLSVFAQIYPTSDEYQFLEGLFTGNFGNLHITSDGDIDTIKGEAYDWPDSLRVVSPGSRYYLTGVLSSGQYDLDWRRPSKADVSDLTINQVLYGGSTGQIAQSAGFTVGVLPSLSDGWGFFIDDDLLSFSKFTAPSVYQYLYGTEAFQYFGNEAETSFWRVGFMASDSTFRIRNLTGGERLHLYGGECTKVYSDTLVEIYETENGHKLSISQSLIIAETPSGGYFSIDDNTFAVDGVVSAGVLATDVASLAAGISSSLNLDASGSSYLVTAGRFGIKTSAPTTDVHMVADTLRIEGLDGTGEFLRIDANGNITKTVIDTADIDNFPTFAQGTWTPTLTGVTNIDAVTLINAAHKRDGDWVICFGGVSVDPTSTGTTAFRMTLPVASNFTATTDVYGCTAVGASTATQDFLIGGADVANDAVEFSGSTNFNSATTLNFSFMYQIK